MDITDKIKSTVIGVLAVGLGAVVSLMAIGDHYVTNNVFEGYKKSQDEKVETMERLSRERQQSILKSLDEIKDELKELRRERTN